MFFVICTNYWTFDISDILYQALSQWGRLKKHVGDRRDLFSPACSIVPTDTSVDDIGLGNLTPFGRGRRELKVLPHGHVLLIKTNFLKMFVHHLNTILFLGYGSLTNSKFKTSNAWGFASGGS